MSNINIKRDKNIYIYIIALICIISIIPFIVVSFYSRPSADDFDYSYNLYHLIKSGNYSIFSLLLETLNMVKTFYFSWQGTYSSAILMSLQTGIWGDKYYFVGILLLLILMYLCLYRLINVVNKRFFDKKYKTWFVSLLFFTVLLQTVPYICQCLYWQCGAFHYVPFFFLDLVVVSYIIEYYCEESKRKKNIDIIISSILSFIISGGNQVTSFLNILILCLSIMYAFYKKKDKGLIITLIAAIVGFIIMYIAPGNSARVDATIQTNVFMAIINSFKGAYKYMLIWPSLSWLSFIVIMLLMLLPIINDHEYKISINPIIVCVLSYLLYVAMFCPTNYAMSTNGPGRLKNVIYFAGVMFSILDTIYTYIWIKQKYNIKLRINNIIRMFLIVGLTVAMCFSKYNNDIKIVKELSDGTAINFAKAYDERIEKMNNSSSSIVVVEPLPNSEILKFDDITNDINDWRNASWSSYYGVKTITNEK